jgi:hypothetical protein
MGVCPRGFQQGPESQLLDSVATAWGLFHNQDSRFLCGLHPRHFRRSVDVCLFSFLNTGQRWPGGATLFGGVRVRVLLKRSCHHTLLRCKVEIRKQLLIAYGRYNGPIRVIQKHGHECIISNRNQVVRHGLYPGHYSGIFVNPKNAQNAATKRQSGAVPVLLLALLASTTSTYSSLGVLQGMNPRPQLLKASVYHSATSAVRASLFLPLTRIAELNLVLLCLFYTANFTSPVFLPSIFPATEIASEFLPRTNKVINAHQM